MLFVAANKGLFQFDITYDDLVKLGFEKDFINKGRHNLLYILIAHYKYRVEDMGSKIVIIWD